MGIFLTVLKITGLVLLGILALLLLIVICVLFVPIRYKADAVIAETDLEKGPSLILENLTANASFSWLLHLVRGGINYPESKEFTVKVLCFTVFPPKKKKDDDLENEDDNDFEEDSYEPSETGYAEALEKEEGFEAKSDKEEDGEEGDGKGDAILEEPVEEKDSTESDIKEENASYDEDFDDDDDGKDFFEFLGDIFDTIGKIIKIPQDVFKKIQYTISRIYAKINMVKNTLSNDIFKRAFEVTKKQIFRVLKMILPRKFSADFLVGTSDPTITADILAAYGVMYPVLVNKVFLTPDFERQILAGKVHLKGRITVFTIVWAAGVLYFNKDVRKTYRRFKKILDS
ncbi:MAG: hypothetical protein K6E70_05665 [Butyrivibrio sp.]|nr:hypothetical protein [Butyrivibrio sp.]